MIEITTSTITVLSAICVLLFAGMAKGTLGFGTALISIPLLVQVFPARTTLTVMTVPIIVANAGLLVTDGVPWGFLREQAEFFGLLIAGTLVGTFGLVSLPVSALYLALSGYVVTFLVLQRYGSSPLTIGERRGFEAVSGLSGGILGGGVGMAGPPVIPYLDTQTQNRPRTVFVTGLSVAFIVPQVVRLLPLVAVGLYGGRDLALGIVAAIVLYVGLASGARLRPHVPQKHFRYLLNGSLLAIAGKLAADALTMAL